MVLAVISRSFYTFSRQLFDRQKTHFWYLYYLDLAILIFGLPRLLYVIYILKWNKNQITYLRTFDPAVHFLSKIDLTTVMLIFVFALFHIYCKISLTQINVDAPVWRFWLQVTVQLQDDYYQNVLPQNDLQIILNKELTNFKLKYAKNFLFLLPNWALTLVAKMILWVKLENINQNQFNLIKLAELPHLSFAIKKKAVFILLITDKIIFALQIVIGNVFISF